MTKSMSERTARKRARMEPLDSESEASQQEPMRDEEFWFEDGTVTLVAGNVHFRIYKGILAHNSPVFSDMFSLPQPPTHDVSHGPSPPATSVLHLSDSPTDLRHLLRFQMPGVDSRPFAAVDPSFHTISACIRLGHKYQMEHVVQQALEYLTIYYGNGYRNFERADAHIPPNFRAEHAVGVVNMARLVDNPTLLAVALLACCQLEGPALVAGFVREDGTRETLTQEDLGLCIQAKERLIRASVDLALRVCAPVPSSQCKVNPPCRNLLRTFFNSVAKENGYMTSVNPFLSWSTPLAHFFKTRQESPCDKCIVQMGLVNDTQRDELWKKLPSLLGLEVAGYTGGS